MLNLLFTYSLVYASPQTLHCSLTYIHPEIKLAGTPTATTMIGLLGCDTFSGFIHYQHKADQEVADQKPEFKSVGQN